MSEPAELQGRTCLAWKTLTVQGIPSRKSAPKSTRDVPEPRTDLILALEPVHRPAKDWARAGTKGQARALEKVVSFGFSPNLSRVQGSASKLLLFGRKWNATLNPEALASPGSICVTQGCISCFALLQEAEGANP